MLPVFRLLEDGQHSNGMLSIFFSGTPDLCGRLAGWSYMLFLSERFVADQLAGATQVHCVCVAGELVLLY